jgi:hypothetical protein
MMKKTESKLATMRNHFVDFFYEYSPVFAFCFCLLFIFSVSDAAHLQLQYRELQEKYALSGKMVLEYKQQSDSCNYKIESIKTLLNSNN